MKRIPTLRRVLFAGVAFAALTACDSPLDWDLRDLGGNVLDTTRATQNLPSRPEPDDRGIISYPNYQVAVAQRGDTVTSVAARIGIGAAELARYNGLDVDTSLRRDEVLALPSRVSEPSPATGAVTTGPITPETIDVTTLAANAIDRAGPQEPVAAPTITTPTPSTSAPKAPSVSGVEPIRHRVSRGETAYSIARLYNVPVRLIAQWNGLGSDLAVREGQYVLVPQGIETAAPASTNETSSPGTGSETPVPPSAAAPLPDEDPAVTAPAAAAVAAPVAAPDLTPDTKSAGNIDAPLIYPVQGSIIRAYAAGRNDGIDISATPGANVKAAAAGTIAAVTRDTNGIAIVVIRHATDLLTVYTNLENLMVSEGENVTQGEVIGQVKASEPAFVHFEVRIGGMRSANPEDYLP